MSDPAPSAKPHPESFERFRDFARRIIAVPKDEADEKERQWRAERKKVIGQKKRESQH